MYYTPRITEENRAERRGLLPGLLAVSGFIILLHTRSAKLPAPSPNLLVHVAANKDHDQGEPAGEEPIHQFAEEAASGANPLTWIT